MPRRPPELFHSDLHLSRWRRVVLWFCESEVGLSIVGLATIALMVGPVYWFGWWWLACGFCLVVGFLLGYALARSYWASGQDIPKL